MPFTLSHVVVALPLRRFGSVAGAVAVGAMAPDLPLFFRIVPYGFTHRLDMVLMTTLLALGLLLVWRLLIRPAIGELSPTWLAERFPSTWQQSPARTLTETFGGARGVGAIVTLGALLAGVLTHIAWDAFTHADRFGSDLFPVLGDDLLGSPVYGWLQNMSTLVGLVILVWFCTRWVRSTVRRPVVRLLGAGVRWAWWLLLPVLLIAAYVGTALQPFAAGLNVEQTAYLALPSALAVWVVTGLALCAVIALSRWLRGRFARPERSD